MRMFEKRNTRKISSGNKSLYKWCDDYRNKLFTHLYPFIIFHLKMYLLVALFSFVFFTMLILSESHMVACFILILYVIL